MGMWSRIRKTLRGDLHSFEIQEELQFHLDMDTAGGHDRREAHMRLGNVTRIQEETRAMGIIEWLDSALQDVRYGFRAMAANKTFSTVAILSLALGIGANTAIYSFMDSLLLCALPVSDPESLAVLNWGANPIGRDSVMHAMSGNTWSDHQWRATGGIFPFPAFELIRTNSAAIFSSVFAYYPTRKVNVMVKGQAEQAGGEFVSGDYFRGLAVSPAAGRLILPEDDRASAPPVAVLSYPYSLKRFGDAASALGQSLLINNVPFTVAGVAPPGFFGVDPAAAPDFYLPLHSNLLLRLRGGPADAAGYLAEGYYW